MIGGLCEFGASENGHSRLILCSAQGTEPDGRVATLLPVLGLKMVLSLDLPEVLASKSTF